VREKPNWNRLPALLSAETDKSCLGVQLVPGLDFLTGCQQAKLVQDFRAKLKIWLDDY
jgi:hypothetical protein